MTNTMARPMQKALDAHIGQRVKMRRKQIGMSMSLLGRHLGLSWSQVQKYENGSNRIGSGQLYLISTFLGVPAAWFFEELPANLVSRVHAPVPQEITPRQRKLQKAIYDLAKEVL